MLCGVALVGKGIRGMRERAKVVKIMRDLIEPLGIFISHLAILLNDELCNSNSLVSHKTGLAGAAYSHNQSSA